MSAIRGKSSSGSSVSKVKKPSGVELDVTTVVDAIPHIVWMADRSGFGDYHNSRALEFTGLAPEALSGSGWLYYNEALDDFLKCRVVGDEAECRR